MAESDLISKPNKSPEHDSENRETASKEMGKDAIRLQPVVEQNNEITGVVDVSPNSEELQNQQDFLVSQLKSHIEKLECSLRHQSDLSEKQIHQLKGEYESKIDKLAKQTESAMKERDAMVMKYAVSENSVISYQKQIKTLDNKIKDMVKDKESVEARIGSIVSEKGRLLLAIDAKNQEITGIERELTKKKDELHAQSSNLKYLQNKLKSELVSHKETQTKLEKMMQKLRESKEETEEANKRGQEMLQRYEEEAKKVAQLEDPVYIAALDNLKEKYQGLNLQNNQLCSTIQSLQEERLEYEGKLNKLREKCDDYEQSQKNLEAAQAELQSTKLLLARVEERLANCQSEVDRLRQSNNDLLQDMAKCRERECELLSFTQMLTEKNVSIQSQLTAAEARLEQNETDLVTLQKNNSVLSTDLEVSEKKLAEERFQRAEETILSTDKLNELREAVQKLTTQLQDKIGETQLLKKKHAASIKELMRELQACRKRGDTLDTISLSQGSRTSSSSSLNNLESESRASVTQIDQLVIEKIDKLQKLNEKKQEKLEFLEEHSRQLLLELQKKSRIIQSLIMKHEPGGLTSHLMDDNKMAVAKHGGIMASVYSSKPSDDTMTLELSLEINRKLQAVLEDTLLKNIMLKDNIETLGSEIARLASSKS